jgi:hypothetical protein
MRIGSRRTQRKLMDEAFEAYLQWREACDEVWLTYRRWRDARTSEARSAFYRHRAALEREEHAARVYGHLVDRLLTVAAA